MPEKERTGHVGPAELAGYVDGKLSENEARLVKGHLEKCARCRLELERFERFEKIDADRDLAREADWASARTKLEAKLRDEIMPSVVKKRSKVIRMPRGARAVRWLMPAAAAAVLILFAAYFGVKERSQVSGPSRGPMRGVPVEYGISLKEPVGELKAPPGVFSWQSERKDDYYSLEIFDADLKTLYRVGRISESSWKAPDSLGTMLKPGSIYLWSVKGYMGLERVLQSPKGWFRVGSTPH